MFFYEKKNFKHSFIWNVKYINWIQPQNGRIENKEKNNVQ